MEESGDLAAREALSLLNRLHPGRFVLLGGGALRLLHESPRASADLDLHVEPVPGRPELRALAEALEEGLVPLAARVGGPLSVRAAGSAVEVRSAARILVRLEFTSFARPRRVEKRLLRCGTPGFEVVVAAAPDELLFGKAAALFSRPHPKGRDAFDIWYLRERGAQLERASFEDWLAWEEIGPERIAARLAEFTPRRLAADLERFLPADLSGRLSATGYEPLRAALRALLEPFL